MATREIYTGPGYLANLGTSWTDIIPLVASGEVIVANVRVISKSTTSSTKVDASLQNSSGTVLAYVIYQFDVGPAPSAIEFDVRVPPNTKLAMKANSAGVVDVIVLDAVRQY